MTYPIPKAKFITLHNGLKIHYHEKGSGPVVLFLHGSGPGASGWSNFKGNYPHLANCGYRTIIPDLPGYGYSSKPPNAQYTLEFFGQTIELFIKALNIKKIILIGNSMGGAVCIHLALRNPNLVHKLILMAPGGLEEREVYMNMQGIQEMLKTFFARKGITKEGLSKTFELQLFDQSLVTQSIIDERYKIALTQPKSVLSTMNIPNQSSKLKHIVCPVLGFWGINDQFCPPSGAITLAKSCSNIRMVLLSQCGHWVMVEHAETFNKNCADFLSEK